MKRIISFSLFCILCSVVDINQVFAACFPAPPISYGKYYPIELVTATGAKWKGKIYPTSTNVEVRDDKNKFVGRFQTTSLTSSSSCSPTGWAKFKIKKIIGDDGNTWIKIERFAGYENYKVTFTWLGKNYYRTN